MCGMYMHGVCICGVYVQCVCMVSVMCGRWCMLLCMHVCYDKDAHEIYHTVLW